MTTKKRKDLKLMFISFIVGIIVTLIIIDIRDLAINKISNKKNISITDSKSLSTAVKKIYDAVVIVKNDSTNGTGFVYKKDNKYAYILTNEHILSSDDKITIITSKELEVTADVLGKDEYLDLAVLRVKKKYANLVATISSSDEMDIGDTVFAVGTPIDTNYSGTVTAGILSAKNRKVTTTTTSNPESDWIMNVLQVDAALNPGNSGGPLLNSNGEVIGICALKLVDDSIEGIGFAIPIEYAMKYIKELENGTKIKWPVLGIKMTNVDDKIELSNNNITIPDNITEGAVILNVNKNSNADRAGFQKGDIIIELNGNKITNSAMLKYELHQHKINDTIKIKYIRDGKEKTVRLKLKSSE